MDYAGDSNLGAKPLYDQGDRSMLVSREPNAANLAKLALDTIKPHLKKDLKDCRVLDIGSGYGQTSLALAKYCQSVVGLEPLDGLYKHAQENLLEKKIDNVSFRNVGVEGLTEEGQYDIAILDNVLEHLPDRQDALNRIGASLKKDGVLYIVVPNKLWPIEVHYGLPFLSYLPLRAANLYLKLTGKGHDYSDACYAPTYWGVKSMLRKTNHFDFDFVLPGNLDLTTLGNAPHYRLGIWMLKRFSCMWAISKAFMIVAKKR